jgi:hypothetical protein
LLQSDQTPVLSNQFPQGRLQCAGLRTRDVQFRGTLSISGLGDSRARKVQGLGEKRKSLLGLSKNTVRSSKSKTSRYC